MNFSDWLVQVAASWRRSLVLAVMPFSTRSFRTLTCSSARGGFFWGRKQQITWNIHCMTVNHNASWTFASNRCGKMTKMKLSINHKWAGKNRPLLYLMPSHNAQLDSCVMMPETIFAIISATFQIQTLVTRVTAYKCNHAMAIASRGISSLWKSIQNGHQFQDGRPNNKIGHRVVVSMIFSCLLLIKILQRNAHITIM